MYECTTCGESFQTKSRIKAHQNAQHKKVFPCNICNIDNLGSNAKYKNHLKSIAHKQKADELNKVKGKYFVFKLLWFFILGKVPKPKKKKRDGEPKKPPNAWTLWSKETREQVKQEYGLKGNAVTSKLGELWQKLKKNEKKQYEDQADELKVSNNFYFNNYLLFLGWLEAPNGRVWQTVECKAKADQSAKSLKVKEIIYLLFVVIVMCCK